jgi:hypothetical protein
MCTVTTEAQEMAMSKSEELGVKCVPSLNLVYTQVRVTRMHCILIPEPAVNFATDEVAWNSFCSVP